MKDQALLARLNAALATEIVCLSRYRRHHFMAAGEHSSGPAEEFRAHSNAAQGHVDQLASSIVQLGGEPDFSAERLEVRRHAEYVEGATLIDLIDKDLGAECMAIGGCRTLIADLGGKHASTQRLLGSILAVRQSHADELASLLSFSAALFPATGRAP